MENPNLYGGNQKDNFQLSEEEKEIIYDIRALGFGRVLVFIQDGVIIAREITKTIKRKNPNKSKNFGGEGLDPHT